MSLEVGRIILFAKDMVAMSAFYRDVVGLSPSPSEHDSPDFVTFAAGAVELCLHAIPEPFARGIEISSPPEVREATPIKFAFRSSDVRGLRERLQAQGARMGPVQEFEGLELCDGSDPEGNVFQVSNR